MSSNSEVFYNSVESQVSSEQLGPHTGPTSYVVEDVTSGQSKRGLKTNSDESADESSKRRRTNQSPAQSSDNAASEVCTGPTSYVVEDVTSGQRKRGLKRTAFESAEEPSKRRRTNQSPAQSSDNAASEVFTGQTRYFLRDVTSGRIKRKRTADESAEKTRKRKRTNQSPAQSSDNAASEVCTGAPDTTAALTAKYVEGALLGEGGFGSVFSGHRRHDNLPVAIKHICRKKKKLADAKKKTVPLEVKLMLRLKPASEGTSAVVALLDWYDLRDELVLVMERPEPCMDLWDYVMSTDSGLHESEAKSIMKQLVDGLIEIHSKGVFHKDIKLENILCTPCADGPRIRIIDFGCSAFLYKRMYTTAQATPLYTSPEWFVHRRYRAEPATVWQLGVVLFEMLHLDLPFEETADIINKDVCVKEDLSCDCRDLLLSCLNKDPAARPSLETLKHHSWLL